MFCRALEASQSWLQWKSANRVVNFRQDMRYFSIVASHPHNCCWLYSISEKYSISVQHIWEVSRKYLWIYLLVSLYIFFKTVSRYAPVSYVNHMSARVSQFEQLAPLRDPSLVWNALETSASSVPGVLRTRYMHIEICRHLYGLANNFNLYGLANNFRKTGFGFIWYIRQVKLGGLKQLRSKAPQLVMGCAAAHCRDLQQGGGGAVLLIILVVGHASWCCSSCWVWRTMLKWRCRWCVVSCGVDDDGVSQVKLNQQWCKRGTC